MLFIMASLNRWSEAHKMPNYTIYYGMVWFNNHLCFHTSFVSSRRFKALKSVLSSFDLLGIWMKQYQYNCMSDWIQWNTAESWLYHYLIVNTYRYTVIKQSLTIVYGKFGVWVWWIESHSPIFTCQFFLFRVNFNYTCSSFTNILSYNWHFDQCFYLSKVFSPTAQGVTVGIWSPKFISTKPTVIKITKFSVIILLFGIQLTVPELEAIIVIG